MDHTPEITSLERLQVRLNEISEYKYKGRVYDFFHTNDSGVIFNLKDIVGVDPHTSGLRFGIIIGTGAILSMLPELPIDAALMLDIDESVHTICTYLVAIFP